jgi:hypothetical protein
MTSVLQRVLTKDVNSANSSQISEAAPRATFQSFSFR